VKPAGAVQGRYDLLHRLIKAGLRAAASGGRPRAGSDTTTTGQPASPSRQVIPNPIGHRRHATAPDTCHTPSEQETKPRPLVVAMSGLGDLLATTFARQVEAEHTTTATPSETTRALGRSRPVRHLPARERSPSVLTAYLPSG
jgi:hypothetical protein